MKMKFALSVGMVLLVFTFLGQMSLAVVDGVDGKGDATITSVEEESKEAITENGTVKSLEGNATGWMYGTHILLDKETGERYALDSDALNLDEYKGEKVMIEGVLEHSGIDTGPPLIQVENVEPIEEGISQEASTKKIVMIAGILIFAVVVGVIAIKL